MSYAPPPADTKPSETTLLYYHIINTLLQTTIEIRKQEMYWKAQRPWHYIQTWKHVNQRHAKRKVINARDIYASAIGILVTQIPNSNKQTTMTEEEENEEEHTTVYTWERMITVLKYAIHEIDELESKRPLRREPMQALKDEISKPFTKNTTDSKSEEDEGYKVYGIRKSRSGHLSKLMVRASGRRIDQQEDTIREIRHLLDTLVNHTNELVEQTKLPTLLQRLWIPITGVTVLNLPIALYLKNNSNRIINTISDAQAFTWTLLKDWVIKPLHRIYSTVRHQENLSLFHPDSLHKDMESLQRMVVSYTKDPAIIGAVKDGDLSTILRAYETQIQHPIKNALVGDILQLALIQVQKTKVDLEIAMAALDKLLRANELNFAFVAVAPTLLIMGGIMFLIHRYIARAGGVEHKRLKRRLLSLHRNIHRLLVEYLHEPLPYHTHGLLLVEAVFLRESITDLPSSIRTNALEDINDLEAANVTVDQRLATLERMKSWME